MVYQFKSKNFLQEENKFDFFNQYASPIYLQLFGVIGLVILWAISQGNTLSWAMIPIVLITGLALPYLTFAKMKNKPTRILLDGEFLCIHTAYDDFKNNAEYFEHRDITGPVRKGGKIILTYKGRVFELLKEDWPEFDQIWTLMNVREPL